jgi:hypothetical protein
VPHLVADVLASTISSQSLFEGSSVRQRFPIYLRRNCGVSAKKPFDFTFVRFAASNSYFRSGLT